MKRRFYAQAIISAVSLLAVTSVHAVEKAPSAAAGEQAVQESASGQAKPEVQANGKGGAKDGVAKAEESESVTISMKVPLFSPSFAGIPVAAVNGDKISIEELTSAIAAMHEGMTEQQTSARKSYKEILNRLINIKLLVQEAENMGMDQLKDVKSRLDVHEKNTLREILFLKQVQGVKLDEKLAEQRYREQVKEWKVIPLRFAKEAAAKAFVQELKKGKPFGELAEKAIQAADAQGSPLAVSVQTQGLQPQIVAAISKLKKGEATGVIPVAPGFAVVKYEDVLFPDKPTVKEELRAAVLNEQKKQVLTTYKESLLKKYVKINHKLLKQIDFEAPKPGFKAMLKDKRVLAEVQGEKPVTVGDLADSMKQKFFHGVEIPIKEKKVNDLKAEQLDTILQKRVFLKEAYGTGVDKSDDYLNRFREYKQQILFGMFIESVIRKEVKVSDEEIQAYYNEHSKDPEYLSPEMVKMEALAFGKLEQAQSALDKLKQGVDFKWLKTNAEGLIAETDPKVLNFGGNLIATTTLSQELQKVLTGVHSKDYRLYADPEEGYFYAIGVLDVIPQRAKPLSEVRVSISNIIYTKNLSAAIDDWSKKLREAGELRVYADFEEIR